MTATVRVFVQRMTRTLGFLAAPLLVLLSITGVALACVAPAEPTTLTTSLSGESKSGAEITVLEGSKVKDQATLEGKNASKATGKITYKVYKDSSCKELATSAGESEFKEGKVPASEEKTLEAGKTYYWQAHYGGDSQNAESTSSCGSEVLKVKAATGLSATLFSEGEGAVEGTEISVMEGTPVKVKATLSGANIAAATGTVSYAVYADKECKKLVASAGEGVVEGSKVGNSKEINLEGEATYYVVASYGGDPLHQPSANACGNRILVVKTFKYQALAYPVGIVGESFAGAIREFFNFNGQIVKCGKGNYTAALAFPAESLKISPSYAECEGFVLGLAVFEPRGCGFELAKPKKIGSELYVANASIFCAPPASAMVFKGQLGAEVKCEIRIGAQSGIGTFELLNLFGPPKSLRIEPNLSGFAYSVTISEEPLGCGLAVESYNGGSYVGKFGLPLTEKMEPVGELYVG